MTAARRNLTTRDEIDASIATTHDRRVNAWRENTFWEQARRHFRIEHPQGPLL